MNLMLHSTATGPDGAVARSRIGQPLAFTWAITVPDEFNPHDPDDRHRLIEAVNATNAGYAHNHGAGSDRLQWETTWKAEELAVAD